MVIFEAKNFVPLQSGDVVLSAIIKDLNVSLDNGDRSIKMTKDEFKKTIQTPAKLFNSKRE